MIANLGRAVGKLAVRNPAQAVLRSVRSVSRSAFGETEEDGQRFRRKHVVLMHGFLGFRRMGPLHYFTGVRQALEACGFRAHCPSVNPLHRTAHRAYQWFYGVTPNAADVFAAEPLFPGDMPAPGRSRPNAHIAEAFLASGRPVQLIAHSQGCLDARFLLSPNGLGLVRPFDHSRFPRHLRQLRIIDCVDSLATVAGCHNGLLYAESEDASLWLLDTMVDPEFGRLVSWFSGQESDGRTAIAEFGRGAMLAFNRQHPDPEGVKLYSVAGMTTADRVTFFLRSFYQALYRDPRFEREDCDGLVNISSAKWPVTDAAALPRAPGQVQDGLPIDLLHPAQRHGNWDFLGMIQADHVDQIGLPFAYPTNRFFRHLDLYVGLAHKMAGDFGPNVGLRLDGTWGPKRATWAA